MKYQVTNISSLSISVLMAGLLSSLTAQADSSCYTIDLKTGASSAIPHVEFVVAPEDFNGDGYFETVLKVHVNDPAHGHWPKSVAFLVDYDADPYGITVNVGDSSTNDGFAGDSATQSNDAELVVGGLISEETSPWYDELRVWGHDGFSDARGVQQMANVSNVAKQGETLAVAVANDWLGYQNKTAPITGVISSPWLYALKGQADSEGPVNYDVYASFNRVIADNSRWGAGASKVKVCLLDYIPKVDQEHHHDHHDLNSLK